MFDCQGESDVVEEAVKQERGRKARSRVPAYVIARDGASPSLHNHWFTSVWYFIYLHYE